MFKIHAQSFLLLCINITPTLKLDQCLTSIQQNKGLCKTADQSHASKEDSATQHTNTETKNKKQITHICMLAQQRANPFLAEQILSQRNR